VQTLFSFKQSIYILKYLYKSWLKSKIPFWLLAVLLVYGLLGCQTLKRLIPSSSRENVFQADKVAAQKALLQMLERANLHQTWKISQLPLGKADHIKQIFYHNGQLFVLNNLNTLYALNAENGIINWVSSLADREVVCSSPYYHDGRMLFVAGNTVVEVRENDGTILYKLDPEFTISTCVARTADRLFLGATDKIFYSLRISDSIPLWQSVCPEEPIGPVEISNDNVYFTCANGTLYVSQTNQRQLVWQAVTSGKVPGALVDGQQCLLPSSDTALYCFDSLSGKLLWKYLAGGTLVELPVVTGELVYQPVGNASLVCLNRKDGTSRWELKDGVSLVAENGNISYLMTLNNELTLMDNSAGKRLLSFYIPDMSLFARNNENAGIFLAGSTGSIMALSPEGAKITR